MPRVAKLSSIGLFLSFSLWTLSGCNSETVSDSGVTDAGPDGGVQPDGGLDDGGPDAGLPDSGIVDDGGNGDAGPDAGDVDAGPDAGDTDAGPDAGLLIASLDFIDTPATDLVLPSGITADGTIAALWDRSTTVVYYYDVNTKQLTNVTMTNDTEAPIYGISGDGSRVVGIYGIPYIGAVWGASSGWVEIGSSYDAGCDPFESGGFGINFDGTVAVGNLWHGCYTDAFRWVDNGDGGVVTVLDKLGSATGSDRGSVVSADGRVVGGFVQTDVNDRSPAIWQADGSGIRLDLTDYAPGEITAINADGSMAAGIYNLEGFYWTLDAGMVDIGKLPNAFPTDSTYLNAIAANGQLLFGGCGDPGGIPQAIVWTQDGGMRTLQDIAVAQGLTIPGTFVLSVITGASADGTVLLGQAVDETYTSQAFILKLPVSLYGITP
jgi:hypothetical protein